MSTGTEDDDELPPGIVAAWKARRILNDQRQEVRRDEAPGRREEDQLSPLALRVGAANVSAAALAQLAIWVVTIVLAYGALSTRIAVLETKYDSLARQLSDISLKLDRLLEKK